MTCLRAIRTAPKRFSALSSVIAIPNGYLRHVPAPTAPGPGLRRRKASARDALLAFGVCHSALLFVGPARHRRGRRVPSASGFGRFPPCRG